MKIAQYVIPVILFAGTPVFGEAQPSKLQRAIGWVNRTAANVGSSVKQTSATVVSTTKKVIDVTDDVLDFNLRARTDYPPVRLGALPTDLRAATLDLALLANAVYEEKGEAVAGSVEFVVIDEMIDPVSGFKCRVYQNAASKRVVMAFEGTTGSLKSPKWLTNYANFLGKNPAEYARAVEFVHACRAKPELKEYVFTLTGHSLGGGLAAYASLSTGISATTFNAAGIGDGLLATLEASDICRPRLQAAHVYVTNINTRYDPIAALGGQLGCAYTIACPAPALRLASVRLSASAGARWAYDAFVAAHFMDTVIKNLH